MPNRHRGEIDAEIGGRKRTLVLTLGALAELEAAFGAGDLAALTERFAQGRMSARDLIRIIGAGLRGAGESVTDDEVARMASPDGAQGYVRIAADLIEATFGDAARAHEAVSLGRGDRLRARRAAAVAAGLLVDDAARAGARDQRRDRRHSAASPQRPFRPDDEISRWPMNSTTSS